MGAALPDHDTLDVCATGGAGLAVALVHAEMVLEFTAAVDTIYTGSIAYDPLI